MGMESLAKAVCRVADLRRQVVPGVVPPAEL